MKTEAAPAVISAATPADVAAITVLLRDAELPHEDFAEHLPHFLVARHGGAVVGAVGFELHGLEALLRSLVVAPGWRGAGLGGRLVAALEAAAARTRVERFFLLTTTAEAFFAHRGFQKVPRTDVPAGIAATREFNSLCPASAVCMMRAVTSAARP